MTDSASYMTPYQMLPDIIVNALKEDTVEDVMVDGHGTITIERRSNRERSGHMEEMEKRAAMNVAAFWGGRENVRNGNSPAFFSHQKPFLSVRLPNGERLEAWHYSLSVDGTSFVIRKFGDLLTLDDLTASGTITETQKLYLMDAVGHKTIMISGVMRSGKTTLLKALIESAQDRVRWAAIESETELQQPNCGNRIQVENRAEIADAIKSSLRGGYDMIVVSEIRDAKAAKAFIGASLSGHQGLSTTHAGSAKETVDRFRSWLTDADMPASYIQAACKVIVHIKKLDNGRRVVTEILEMEGGGMRNIT